MTTDPIDLDAAVALFSTVNGSHIRRELFALVAEVRQQRAGAREMPNKGLGGDSTSGTYNWSERPAGVSHRADDDPWAPLPEDHPERPKQCGVCGTKWVDVESARGCEGRHDIVDDEGGFETARITITRTLTANGADVHRVEATSGMSLIEALGMLRLAESTLLEFPPGADDEDDE